MREKFTLCKDFALGAIPAGTSYDTQLDNTNPTNCTIIVRQIRVFGSLFDSTGAPKLSVSKISFATMQTQALPIQNQSLAVTPAVYFSYSEGVINGYWYVRAGTNITVRILLYGSLLATDAYRGSYTMNYELDM